MFTITVVRCRIICSSLLISNLYLHNRSNRTFIDGQPGSENLESGSYELKYDIFVCISFSINAVLLILTFLKEFIINIAMVLYAQTLLSPHLHNRSNNTSMTDKAPRSRRSLSAMEAATPSHSIPVAPPTNPACVHQKTEGDQIEHSKSISIRSSQPLYLHLLCSA